MGPWGPGSQRVMGPGPLRVPKGLTPLAPENPQGIQASRERASVSHKKASFTKSEGKEAKKKIRVKEEKNETGVDGKE